ncbi:MAG: cytosine deaminase [Hyphomicrobiales bacterium]|nr:MAG: cytosine deaminase [Hyphomicrobiales bacterium]
MPEILIQNANIVSMDDKVGDFIGDILISDDKILEVGKNLTAPEGAKIIDASGKIALPGFVNAHIHTWQTALRGIAADWTISQYLRAMHAGLATHFSAEDIGIANAMGALNQINSGTTTLVDWCHNNPTAEHTDAAVEGLQASGIRAVFLHGSPKPDPKSGQKHFSELPMPRSEVERLRKGSLSSNDALVTMGLAVLGPQMSVWEVCEADFNMAKEMGLIASMHVSGPLMVEDGFEQLAALGLLGSNINIVHGNVLSGDRLKLLVDQGCSFSLTPEVELQMGFGNPLTSPLRELGGLISLGSDIESAMTGDMFSVARATLQAVRHADNLVERASTGACPPEITVTSREALRWVTIDGARMAGLDHKIGSLTPGKQADIVLLDATAINMHPVNDPVASILFHANTGNVDTVLIDGNIVKQDGALTSPPSEQQMNQLATSGARIIGAFQKS